MPAATASVRIEAKDGTSGVVAALNKRLASINKEAAKGRKPFEDLGRNYSKFLQLSGADRIAGGLGAVARAGTDAARSAVRIVEPLAAITGAASVAGMVKLALAWSSFGTQLGQTATRAGLAVRDLHGLENAARLAGVSSGSMSSGLVALKDNMTNAVGGLAPEAVKMFGVLGISFRDAAGHARTTTDVLPELADKIAAMKDPTLEARIATTLFGGAGEALLPFLRRGREGIAEYTEKAQRYGLMNDEAAAAANRLREAQASLTMAVEGLGNSVAEKLAPVIGPVIEQMASWIGRNRDWIATGIGDAVGRFVEYLKGVDWPAIGAGIDRVLTLTGSVVSALGGWKVAAEVVVGLFAASWAASLLTPLVAVGAALLKLPLQAAGAASEAEGKLGRSGLLGSLGKAVVGGAIAHEVLQQVDPNDSMGAWIDRNIPGAAAVDNLASKVGLGRSYEQQAEVDRALGHGPGLDSLRLRAQGHFEAPAPGAERRADWMRDHPIGARPSAGPAGPAGTDGGALAAALEHQNEGPSQVAGYLAQGGTGVNPSTQAWCAAFVNSSLKQAGMEGSHSQVATSFLNWGQGVDAKDAAKGDVVVLAHGHRAGETGGHVGFATGEKRMRNGRDQVQLFQGNYGGRTAFSWENADEVNVRRAPAPAGGAVRLPAGGGTASAPGGAGVMPNGRVDVGVTVPPAAASPATAAPAGPELAPLKVQKTFVGADFIMG